MGGRSRVSTSEVDLLYPTNGVQQPINAGGSSNFKIGRVVPVKLATSDGQGGPAPSLWLAAGVARSFGPVGVQSRPRHPHGNKGLGEESCADDLFSA